MATLVNYNGTIVNADEPILKFDNRAFRFGDAVFETIRIMNAEPLFMSDHIRRLLKGMSVLGMQLSVDFNDTYFTVKAKELITANGITGGARMRLTIFRNGAGFYTPQDNSCSFLLEVAPLTDNEYTVNARGYTIDIYNEVKKQQNPLSSIKTANSLLYVMAGVHKVKNELDDCVLMNVKGDIIESINSNIFAVKNGVLYTPPVTEGCVDGVLRKRLIEVSFKNRIAVHEINLAQSVLLSADELFLTNVVSGIRWVGAYKSKRYFNNTSKLLVEKLNEYITAKKEL